MMADCHGKLTGKPGICFVTRGPGATNASAGIHIAMQDSTPVILFIGQIARRIRDREAFQEVDYRRFFGGVAKWVTEIDDPARIPELVTRAFAVATSGRPGPVVIALPEDVLTEAAEAPAALPLRAGRDAAGRRRARPARGAARQRRAPDRHPRRLALERPTRSPRSRRAAEAWSLPVGCSFRRQMLFDHLHPNYAGDVGIGINPKLADVHQAMPIWCC